MAKTKIRNSELKLKVPVASKKRQFQQIDIAIKGKTFIFGTNIEKEE